MIRGLNWKVLFFEDQMRAEYFVGINWEILSLEDYLSRTKWLIYS